MSNVVRVGEGSTAVQPYGGVALPVRGQTPEAGADRPLAVIALPPLLTLAHLPTLAPLSGLAALIGGVLLLLGLTRPSSV